MIGKAEKLEVSFNIDKRIDSDTYVYKELYDDFIEAFFSGERCNVEHGIVEMMSCQLFIPYQGCLLKIH